MVPDDSYLLPVRFSNFLDLIFKKRKTAMYFNERTQSVWLKFTPGKGAMGPPQHAHGGFSAGVMDEVMGAAAWLNGHTVLGAKLEITYRNSVPLRKAHYIHAWITRLDRRRVYVASELLNDAGAVLVKGRCVFVRIDPGRFTDVPEDMKRFAEFHKLRESGLSVPDAIKVMKR